jgi:drug/metabolite transporter (DMT)-like permease
MKALQYGDLSLIGPLIALTPVFLLITSPFMVGEYPHFYGYIGVVCGVI